VKQRDSGPTIALIPPSCCGAGYFRKLRRALGGRVNAVAVELPGHGRRYREPCLTDAGPATADLAARLPKQVDAVFGESLGAYIGLAVVAATTATRCPLLLVASNVPPSEHPGIDTARVDSLESAVRAFEALGARIPDDVLHKPDVARSAFPLIRDDLLLSHSYVAAGRTTTIASDIRVAVGVDDAACVRGVDGWAAHTTGSCDVVRVPGGHLLSSENPEGVATVILQALGLEQH
jgi:surfactin synthase thioesterase subunit